MIMSRIGFIGALAVTGCNSGSSPPGDSESAAQEAQYFLGSGYYTAYGTPFGETDRAVTVTAEDGAYTVVTKDRTPKVGDGEWTLTLQSGPESGMTGELTTGNDVYAVVATPPASGDDAMQFSWDASGVNGAVQCRPASSGGGAGGQWEFFSPGGNSELLLIYSLVEVSESEHDGEVEGWGSP